MPRWVTDLSKLAVMSAVAVAIVWVFRVDVANAVGLLEVYSDSPCALPIAAMVFIIGSVFLVPQWLLIGATIAAFGFTQGAVVSWVCTLIAAQLHLASASLGRQRLSARLNGPRMARLRSLFSDNSFQSGLVVRLVPTGPALLVNVAAGLAGVRVVPFMVGTAIGIVPKILLTGLVAQGLLSTADGQRLGLYLMLAGMGMIGLFWLSRRKRAALTDGPDGKGDK